MRVRVLLELPEEEETYAVGEAEASTWEEMNAALVEVLRNLGDELSSKLDSK